MTLHKILQSQVKRHLPNIHELPANVLNLLNDVSEAYNQCEDERKELRHAAGVSSLELIELNKNLQEANRELSNLFNNIDEVLYSMDMVDYKTTQISPACERVYGYTPAEFYADPSIWVTMMHPDDVYLAQESMINLMKNNQTKNQCRVIRKDKTVRWVEWSMLPTLNEQGQLTRIDGIVRDITERKNAEELLRQSEANLRTIFETTEVGFLLIDMQDKVVASNDMINQWVMHSYGTTIAKGVNVRELLIPEKQTEFDGLKSILTAGGQVSYETEYPDLRGKMKWHHVNGNPVLDENKNVTGICFAISNITLRKQAEKEIVALNELLEKKVIERTAELQASINEIEAFSYSVSHDLRAPLRVINGYGKMLLKNHIDKFDEEGKQDLRTIMSNAEHMGSLIDDLLDFSRLGRASVTKSEVNMTDIIREAAAEVKLAAKSHAEISIENFEPAYCDPALIKQVWTNLLSNAVKYSRDREKPVIEIGASSINGHLTYFIKDNGAGFDMAYADKLFAVFQRLHKVTEYEGTGVGLALVQRIVSKHGGKVWGYGKVNEGATFYFTLDK